MQRRQVVERVWAWARKTSDSPVRRTSACVALLFWGVIAYGHHWVSDVYDKDRRVVIEVVVEEFAFINPHPVLTVEISELPDPAATGGVAVGQSITLEMDNRRELVALGFRATTFSPGDRLIIAVDPSRDSRFRRNALYLRALAHPREQFVYLHNVRTLYPIEDNDRPLARYLDQVN